MKSLWLLSWVSASCLFLLAPLLLVEGERDLLALQWCRKAEDCTEDRTVCKARFCVKCGGTGAQGWCRAAFGGSGRDVCQSHTNCSGAHLPPAYAILLHTVQWCMVRKAAVCLLLWPGKLVWPPMQAHSCWMDHHVHTSRMGQHTNSNSHEH